MPKLVVLSTPLQYDRFLRQGFDLKEFEVWCNDERHYDFFEKKRIPFNKLEEDLIAEHWEKINTWSCETAARWVAFCREQKIFDGIDWAAVICIVHGYLLAPLLRAYHFSKFLMQQKRHHQAVLFFGSDKKNYPQFSGNDYLNHLLELQCEIQKTPILKIDFEQRTDAKSWQPETRSYFKAKLSPQIKKVINKIYAGFVKPEKSIDVLASGSLRHLDSTIRALKRRGVKVAVYDFEFHLDQFLFSLQERIPYLLPECFPERIRIDVTQYAKGISELFDKAFSLCAESDLFIYDGVNLRELIQNYLFGSMKNYFLRCAEKINHYENMTSIARIKSILVDDDFSVKGGIFAGYFVSKKVPVFCISHANVAVNANVSNGNCNFYQSYTLVNSEFEKANYTRRGWEPSHLIVTGTPRYDQPISMTEERRGERNNRRCKMLFCGTGLWSFSPDVYSYVGHQRECFGQVQIPVLQTVFSAIKDLPVDLVIKPHSFEMIPLWKELIKQCPVKKQIILKKHSDDIFKLLMECDAMILAYWSTAIIESAIAGKPTIYVDFRKVKSPILYEYASQGFCYIVNSQASLTEAIQRVCNQEYSYFIKPVSTETRRYYLGTDEAQASERVCNLVIKELSASTSAAESEGVNVR